MNVNEAKRHLRAILTHDPARLGDEYVRWVREEVRMALLMLGEETAAPAPDLRDLARRVAS